MGERLSLDVLTAPAPKGRESYAWDWGTLFRDLVYQLDRGEHTALRRRLTEMAEAADTVPIPRGLLDPRELRDGNPWPAGEVMR